MCVNIWVLSCSRLLLRSIRLLIILVLFVVVYSHYRKWNQCVEVACFPSCEPPQKPPCDSWCDRLRLMHVRRARKPHFNYSADPSYIIRRNRILFPVILELCALSTCTSQIMLELLLNLQSCRQNSSLFCTNEIQYTVLDNRVYLIFGLAIPVRWTPNFRSAR
jgi:hypothetical protein